MQRKNNKINKGELYYKTFVLCGTTYLKFDENL